MTRFIRHKKGFLIIFKDAVKHHVYEVTSKVKEFTKK